MKVPSGLVIQDRKLTHYLLVYQAEDDKSEFLASAGYTLQTWQLLKRNRLSAMAIAEVAEVMSTDWGDRFKVKAQWDGLNGQRLRVIIIWQQDEDSDTIRFITLYPDKASDRDKRKRG
ncbi:MAG: hypothetical protein KME42_14925 [Tildeniella nuda ZEHNDER 1965/U140]|jgi:hypothetical protein|nr:hypothetical protein [Tildeniella nuda ZEHNDER 1965/U140]